MSGLSDMAGRALAVTGRLVQLASGVQTIEDFGLSPEQEVQLEVLLRDGLREVDEGIREILGVDADGAVLSSRRGAVSRKRVIESVADLHDSPSVGASAAGTVDASTPIVGDAPGPGFQPPFPGPGAISGGAA